MSGTTSVPEPEFTDVGFVAPSEPEIRDGVMADLNAAFGGDLNLTNPETPQGQLGTTLAAIIGNKDDQFVHLTQMFDPAFSTGRYQDALARIYFLERNPAEPTTVQATCMGLAGTVIYAGALAQSLDGNLFFAVDGGTIPSAGSVVLAFACVTDGPIACPVGALSVIYQAIPGWDSIINNTDGVLGNVVESRAEFEVRRAASVAINARSILDSVLGAVLAVDGVLDAYVTENYTGSPLVTGGVTLDPHSLYVAASGGEQADVARAIWTKKAPGCAYNGNTTVTVYDDDPIYTPPGIPYPVTYQIPDSLPIFFAVTLQDNSAIPTDALTQIQGAIVAAFSGTGGGTRARIGQPVLASRFYAPIIALGSWAQVLQVQIGSPNDVGAEVTGSIDSQVTASIAGSTMTVSAVAEGVVRVGDTVSGTGVAAGTSVTALGSGTGGTGTYTVSISQTVGSTTITTQGTVMNVTAVASGTLEVDMPLYGNDVAVQTTLVSFGTGTGGTGTYNVSFRQFTPSETIAGLAMGNSVTVNIDQEPTVSTPNIALLVT